MPSLTNPRVANSSDAITEPAFTPRPDTSPTTKKKRVRRGDEVVPVAADLDPAHSGDVADRDSTPGSVGMR